MQKQKPTWIVVMDGAHAFFYTLERNDSGQFIAQAAPAMANNGKPHARDERSDRPGRSFNSGRGGVRHAIEPHHDFHKLAKHNFTREVAKVIESAQAARSFERLVLVAPRRSLGELRTLLSGKTEARIWREIPKDLAGYTPDALWLRLSPLLHEGPALGAATEEKAALKPARAKKSPGGNVTAEIVFRNMDVSPAIQTSVQKHASKLNQMFSRIMGCRAIIEAPHRHRRKGKIFRVSVDLKLPGREITATNTGAENHAHEDVHVAIRDVFMAVTRQLQDYVRRAKSAPKQGERSSSLRSRRAEV